MNGSSKHTELSSSDIQSEFPNLQLGQPLNHGGQGLVFRATFREVDAVLKLYKDGHETRAIRECQALIELDSPQLVRLLDHGNALIKGVSYVYTITEFVDGTSLDEKIKLGKLSEAELRTIGIWVARAIQALWEPNHIVHRDIKPANIIVRDNGEAIVIDLGIARHTDLETITQPNHWIGTLGYMSPEQARGMKQLTFRSDVFALGVTLYEAATGSHPFDRKQDLVGKLRPVSLQRFGFSGAFSGLIDDMLATDPLDRAPSMVQLLNRFES